ncbi:MAG: DUF503 domain-containing protein [Deltaproteobacteria bacterium]|nr:DUF503 domain-containing protein [Deltaproteobacteria bacterium]
MTPTPTAHIALLMLDLHIPEAASLKSKRKVITSLKERIRSKFNVSVAEIGELDKWQRTIFGIVTIGNDKKFVDSSINSVLNFVSTVGNVQIFDSKIEFL